MVTLIEDVRNRLTEIAGILYIDEDWGQLDEFSQNPPVRWPCALVDIVDAAPSNMGSKVQLIDCTVLIRLADTRLNKTSQKAPEAGRNNANSFFGLAQTVYQLLHGWHGTGSHYGTLARTGFRRVVRDDGIREYHLRFGTQLTDVVAKTPTTDYSGDVKAGIIKLSPTLQSSS